MYNPGGDAHVHVYLVGSYLSKCIFGFVTLLLVM